MLLAGYESHAPCKLAAGEDARCPDRGRPRPQRLAREMLLRGYEGDAPCELAAGEDARCPDRGRPRPQQGDRVGKFRRTSSVIAAAGRETRGPR